MRQKRRRSPQQLPAWPSQTNRAEELLAGRIVVSVQVLNGLANVARRKRVPLDAPPRKPILFGLLKGKWPPSPTPPETAAPRAGFKPLPLTCFHVLAVHGWPLLHCDPFDRMLVAQAIASPYTRIDVDARAVERPTAGQG